VANPDAIAVFYRQGFDLRVPDRKAPVLLALTGGMWHGDTCLFDFAILELGLAGRIECQWTTPGPRFHLVQGDAKAQQTRAVLAQVAGLLRGFFRGVYAGIAERQLADTYRGGYHHDSGYADDREREREDELKSGIATLVVKALRPRKVLDAGCAAGDLVRHLRRLGVEAFGFDLSPDVAAIAHPDAAPYLRQGSLQAIPFGLEDGFDTVVCIDVFEHLPEDRVPAMVAELRRLGCRNLAVHIAHCEFEHLGHITLRPLSWWDARLLPAFERVMAPADELLRLPGPYDPQRVLRIYRRVQDPVLVPRREPALTVPVAARPRHRV